MTRGFAPSVWDRLMGEDARAAPDRAVSRLTLAQLKDTVARDLEALLNTRLVIPKDLLTLYPKCSKSILNYGLVDFAGLCLTSSVDRKAICDCLTAAIGRHEPRLSKVSARLVTQSGTINRLNFAISAILNVPEACEAVKFDAELQPSTLRYSIK